MTSFSLRIRLESPDDNDTVENLAAEAFGPGRFARAAFRLREGVPHEPSLSFVAMMAGAEGEREELAGSVRLTRIRIGADTALVLGPLIVARSRKNLGIGRELMHRSMLEAGRAGHRLVILVGDEPYYGKFGFRKVPPGRITLPGPADPQRILYCELVPGGLGETRGAASRFVQ
ncbi:MAG: N-acetyltransferase [Pseudomonadota bacterium]|nr:N-acetyltransferase [Pseudomonadota bacterium]